MTTRPSGRNTPPSGPYRGEVLRGGGQHLAAAVVDDHEILDPHAEATRHVHARLHRDGVAADQIAFRARCEGGRLVDLEPDSVTEAVAELVAVAALLDDVARDPVEFPRAGAGAHLRQRRSLRR